MTKLYTLDELREDYTPIQEVFFDAMLAGYASKKPEVTAIKELPGSKVIEYRDDPWRVVDMYFVVPNSNDSGGTTLIYYEDTPVWIMHYAGYYPQEVIPFLKSALLTQYQKREFIAGRGPELYENKKYSYMNWRADSNFGSFYGNEEIEKYDHKQGIGETVGEHHYHGRLLI